MIDIDPNNPDPDVSGDMPSRPDNIRAWMPEIRRKCKDRRWISANADDLRDSIRRGLTFTPHVADAVEALLLVSGHAIMHSRSHRWSDLMTDALLWTMDVKDNELMIRVFSLLGQAYMVKGENQAARRAFEKALERAEARQALSAMLKAYIGLLKTQMYQQDTSFTPELARTVRALAREAKDSALQAELYGALASVYTHRGESETALGYGQTSFAYAFEHHDTQQMARTALVLIAACRAAELQKLAEHFLGVAESLLPADQYREYSAILTYERGALYYKSNQPDKAEEWYTMALDTFRALEWHHHIAGCLNALGLAQTALKKYPEAHDNLTKACAEWKFLGNHFDHANAYYALGYMEAQRGEIGYGLSLLQDAIDLCANIPDMKAQSALKERIEQTIKTIEDQSSSAV